MVRREDGTAPRTIREIEDETVGASRNGYLSGTQPQPPSPPAAGRRAMSAARRPLFQRPSARITSCHEQPSPPRQTCAWP